MSRQLTFVILDSESERGQLWQGVTGTSSFEATPPVDGFYHVALEQFTDEVRQRIFETLAAKFGSSAAEVRAEIERLGFIPLKDGPDATFGADLRMVL